jgi:pyruvate/2-oxoglutarate/acetoin dehydrogenase E1 component/TPP-dependent pyruvate/acetoin dehydrogenase alpha subunit
MLAKITSKKIVPKHPQTEDLFSTEAVMKDFEWCCISREVSLLARKEVLTGKAKFAISGDGKELPQVALAKAIRLGDFRSGYYRDQTLMFALGVSSIEQFFAQLYADHENDPFSGGRQMNAHFATPLVDQQTGAWTNHLERFNVTSDISCTAGQMGRALGLAYASTKYREAGDAIEQTNFSDKGNELCICTIGDASTSEGPFWETVNAAGVLQVPLAIFVWDDGFGISVPIEYQTTKGSISEVLSGFQPIGDEKGVDIYTAKAWDYPTLVTLFCEVLPEMRKTHRPAVFHIQEATQPQGHSTSGSHERYKSKERLNWEKEYDCLLQFEKWLHDNGYANAEETKNIRANAKKEAKQGRDRAWEAYNKPNKQLHQQLKAIYQDFPKNHPEVALLIKEANELITPIPSELLQNARRVFYQTLGEPSEARNTLSAFMEQVMAKSDPQFHQHLYSETPLSALKVPVIKPIIAANAPLKNGFEILNAFFDKILEKDPRVFAFGEDVGCIGDVNQGFAGLQDKHGKDRVFDTGIREWTIMGQAIGMAMRGLRPIAEIQYIDYLIYALAPLSDDLACLRYRSNGIQTAPAIIRTRGHRLEGIWHSGSPMGMMLHSLRGIYILTPRNMTQAAGMYNTMLQSDDPAIIVECLNGYRLKETLPENMGTYTVPIGEPEVLQYGRDVTLVTYGSCVRIAQEGIKLLEKAGISVELIDAQTLLPFDIHHTIVQSLQKTNRLLVLDEDMPGGASAYILREILEIQNGYRYLDSAPQTLAAHPHRPAYGSDGDYFSKPNPEDVFEAVYNMVYESQPSRFRAGLR